MKTRVIAEMLGISIYRARCYLCELKDQGGVDSTNEGGRGSTQ
ncbi:FaeA/PapI family transcriptional regulator [Yersinia enterocolitica]